MKFSRTIDQSPICLLFLNWLNESFVCSLSSQKNDLYEIFQSAYRQLHSTETALFLAQNDILQTVDAEGRVILVLLDLSAAFDTIDYQKLLNLLDYSFGIRGDSLRWFKSYLQDRTQTVQIGSSTSEPVTLKYGVPQGSVLGPILFTMNTTPLGNICNHSLNFHLYADDTQFYISFKPRGSISRQTAISQVEACIKDIKTWMTNNLLKLNDDKTELLVITTIMYSIGKIRKYLDKPTTEKMINSAVTSHLDYCNSLLYGINGYLVSQLQHCQNNAARIVSLRRKYDHITPVLKNLHWLPVEHRIITRFCCWPTRLNNAWLHRTCHHYCRPTNLGGLYDLRVNISWQHLIIWKVLASIVLRMTPLPFGTHSPFPSSVSSPLTLSRAVLKHICLM